MNLMLLVIPSSRIRSSNSGLPIIGQDSRYVSRVSGASSLSRAGTVFSALTSKLILETLPEERQSLLLLRLLIVEETPWRSLLLLFVHVWYNSMLFSLSSLCLSQILLKLLCLSSHQYIHCSPNLRFYLEITRHYIVQKPIYR